MSSLIKCTYFIFVNLNKISLIFRHLVIRLLTYRCEFSLVWPLIHLNCYLPVSLPVSLCPPCLSPSQRGGVSSRSLWETASVQPEEIQLLPLRVGAVRPAGSACGDWTHCLRRLCGEREGEEEEPGHKPNTPRTGVRKQTHPCKEKFDWFVFVCPGADGRENQQWDSLQTSTALQQWWVCSIYCAALPRQLLLMNWDTLITVDQYSLNVCVCSGVRTEQDLYVRLIDSMTKQVRFWVLISWLTFNRSSEIINQSII